MANKYRGDVTITIMGKDYTLHPSFDSMCQFEDITGGLTIFDGLESYQNNKLSVKITVGAIWSGIYGHYQDIGEPLKCPAIQEIGELCKSHGMSELMMPVIEYFTNCLSSDAELEEKAKKKEAETESPLTPEG